MTPTTALGLSIERDNAVYLKTNRKINNDLQCLSIRLSMFELRETGDWDIFLGPLERARAETGGANQWVLKRRECSGLIRVNEVTSASLGYPLSVFNKNSTLKPPLATVPFRAFCGLLAERQRDCERLQVC